jgi:hypothetical protein
MLAMGAGGVQLMIAFGAVVESALHSCVTLRASTEQRLPQNQIQNDAKTVSDHNRDHRPERPVHATASGVTVDVDDQQEIATDYGSGEKTKKAPDRGRGGISLNRQQGREEDLHAHKDQDSHSVGPFGNESQFLGKLGSYVTSQLHMSSPLNLIPATFHWCQSGGPREPERSRWRRVLGKSKKP